MEIRLICLTPLSLSGTAKFKREYGIGEGNMKYENIIENVSSKYSEILQRRHFKSQSSVVWSIVFGTEHLISLILRFPLSRIPYLSVMNSSSSPKKLSNLLEMGVRRATIIHPPLAKSFRTGKTLIIYYSITGNTEKVALAIQEGAKKAGLEPTLLKVSEASKAELYEYDLVCIGTPVIHGLPPHPVMKFILEKGSEYRKRFDVRTNTRKIPGKNALVFVTFSGPHIGVEEAIPTGKYVRQSLHHMGFDVKDEWYVVGEFHGWKDGSTRGRMGDIRGRPNAKDLARIEKKTIKLVKTCIGSNTGET